MKTGNVRIHGTESRGSDRKTVWSVKDFAEYFGISTNTVYEAIRRKEIPGVVKIGKTYKICRESVLDWFANGRSRVPR